MKTDQRKKLKEAIKLERQISQHVALRNQYKKNDVIVPMAEKMIENLDRSIERLQAEFDKIIPPDKQGGKEKYEYKLC